MDAKQRTIKALERMIDEVKNHNGDISLHTSVQSMFDHIKVDQAEYPIMHNHKGYSVDIKIELHSKK